MSRAFDSDVLPGYMSQSSGPTFPGTDGFVGSPLPSEPVLPGISPRAPDIATAHAAANAAIEQHKAATDQQIMDKLTHIFGKKKDSNYWPLLTFVTIWLIFGLIILIIFLSAGKTGWGFYYLVHIIFLGLVLGIIVWVFCAEGYKTMAWVVTGISFFIVIGFIIWASVAFDKIKNLSRSPFG